MTSLVVILGALASFVGVLLAYVLLRVARDVMTDEARGWVDHLPMAVLERAVRELPEGERDRWRAEWIGELATLRGRPLSAIRAALDIYGRAQELAGALKVPVPADGRGADFVASTEAEARRGSQSVYPSSRRLADQIARLLRRRPVQTSNRSSFTISAKATWIAKALDPLLDTRQRFFLRRFVVTPLAIAMVALELLRLF